MSTNTHAGDERIIVHDVDLHANLLSKDVGDTLQDLQSILITLLNPDAGWNAAALLNERQRLHDGDGWEEFALRIFDICPHNLAERFLEALVFYRAIGAVGLPEMLPLALLLLDADMHSYFAPKKNLRKPYRDHLPHQVRVASFAHLLMSAKLPLIPWNAYLEDRFNNWTMTREHHLLIEHHIRTGLLAGFPGNPEDLRRNALAASLLAGLVHDIGYALKTVAGETGAADEALRHFGIFPGGPEPFSDPPVSPVTRMYRIFWERTQPGDRYSTMCEYVRDHPDSPHSLAGAMWLAYLPERMLREGLYKDRNRGDDEIMQCWGRLEFICHLAGMMALVHDFPLESQKKQGSQGFRMPNLGASETLSDQFPLCAAFSMSDILHEFGRPYVYTSAGNIRVYAPVLGIDFLYPDEWNRTTTERHADKKKCLETGLISKEQAKLMGSKRIELFWDVRDSRKYFAPAQEPDAAFLGRFDESLHGSDILSRLHAWGLDRIFCHRDVEAARAVKSRGNLESTKGLGLRKTPRPADGGLAVHPIEDYNDECRKLREKLSTPPLL